MKIKRLAIAQSQQAEGLVVVIDVVRAFTTAAHAFDASASEIVLTDDMDEALALRQRLPGAWVMGEALGIKPAAFDLGNSPAALSQVDLDGRRLIQRTSAGTRGVVAAFSRADTLLTCSLNVAAATARHIQRLAPDVLTFIITGIQAGNPDNDGDEDAVCADYVTSLLRGEPLSTAELTRRVRDSFVGRTLFLNPDQPAFRAVDLDYCCKIDCFEFVMPVTERDGLLTMRPVAVPPSSSV